MLCDKGSFGLDALGAEAAPAHSAVVIVGTCTDLGPADGLAQAASGNLYLSGPADQPSRAAVPYVDFSTATIAALSTLAALMHRGATGEGQLIAAGALG